MKPRPPKARFCCLCGHALASDAQRELGLIPCACPWRLPFEQWPHLLRKRVVAAVCKPTEGAA